ncbi:MAG: hypothetical protein WD448_09805 [Woeseia sp.]
MKHSAAFPESGNRHSLGFLAILAFTGAGATSALAQDQQPAASQQQPASQQQQQGSQQAQSSPKATEVIQEWPQTSKEVAQTMIEEYGEPDGVTDSMLTWNDNGPWVRTIVHKEEIDHKFPVPHKDVLEQFINYEVPEEKFSDLAKYDGSVVAYRTNGEMSARCDKEAANFLALNLAHDLIEGERGVEDARAFYAQTVQQMMQGEQPEYVQGLQFEVRSASATADPDEPFEQMAAAETGTGEKQGVASLSADQLQGKKVLSVDGEVVGEVVGVSQDQQSARVELDTFLGLGAREVELPLSGVSLNPDGDLETTMSEDDISSLPEAGEEPAEDPAAM